MCGRCSGRPEIGESELPSGCACCFYDEMAQRAQFVTANLMCCRLAALLARDVHCRSMEVDRVPSKFAYFGRTEAVPVGDEDHGGIAVAVAITFGGFDQLLDLGLGQVLALPVSGVGTPTGGNCSLLCRLALPPRGAISPAFADTLGPLLLA
jgi:hypothetical protein